MQSSYHTATFGDAVGSELRIVFTENFVTVNSISFNNEMGGSYAIAGRSVNMNASIVGMAASVGAAAGQHEFQASFCIVSNTTGNVAAGAQLTFNNGLNLNGQTLTKRGDGTMTVNNVLNTGCGTRVGHEGTISGSGTVGRNLNCQGGTISPGRFPGQTSSVPEPSAMA